MGNVDKLLRTMKGLLRLARIVASSSNDKAFPVQQIEYLGRNCDATIWLPYGMHANLPPDVLAIAMSLNGNLETRYAFPSSPKERLESPLPNPLEEGDLLLFNPVSKAYVYLKADGDIDINSTGTISITAPDIKLTGDVDINGTVIRASDGRIISAEDVLSTSGVSLQTHTHAQGVDSDGSVEVEVNAPT